MYILIFSHWTGYENFGYVDSLLGVYSSLKKAKDAATTLGYNASDEWIKIKPKDRATYWETECGLHDNSYKIYRCELDRIDDKCKQEI